MFKPELEALQTAIKAKYDDIQKLESQLIEKMTKQVELMQVNLLYFYMHFSNVLPNL